MRYGWRMNSLPLRIVSVLRSARRRKRSDDMRRCKNAWMIGMHSIPIYMLRCRHPLLLQLQVTKCSQPDQLVLQEVKLQFNPHIKCIRKLKQIQVDQRDHPLREIKRIQQ